MTSEATGTSRVPLRLVIGAGGALLIAALFMPWAGGRSGWELLTTADVFFLVAGVVALVAAITGGRIGLFRPDLTLIAATDLLALVAIVLTGWLLVFDFPAGAAREVGAFLALIAATTIAAGAGDYRPLRGASWFPRVP